jgi:hypothetical protein
LTVCGKNWEKLVEKLVGGKTGLEKLVSLNCAISGSHVCSANSASWLMIFAGGAVSRSFLGRPRAQCPPNCSDIA